MTFQDLEQSQQAADPKELYRFVRGTECWLYTSADEDTVYANETYFARTISRGAFQRNDEAASSELEVRLDRALGVVAQFLDGSSAEPITLTVLRLHRPLSAIAIIEFTGTIANISIEIEEVVLLVQSPLGKDSKEIPRELMLRTCPHELYGERCRVDPDAFKVETTISSVSGDPNEYDITSRGGHAQGFFKAGVLVKDSTGQRGFIQKDLLGIFLLVPMPGLAVSDAVTVFAGCDRKVETCRDKFANVAEYGGFPALPERNPFVSIPAEDILDPT